MKKNTLNDLQDHLFATLEALTDETATDEEIERAIKVAGAVTGISQQIINNGRLQLDAMKHMSEYSSGYSTGALPTPDCFRIEKK